MLPDTLPRTRLPSSQQLIDTLYNPSGLEEWKKLMDDESFDDAAASTDAAATEASDATSLLRTSSSSSPTTTTTSSSRALDLTNLYDPQLHLPSAPTDWTGYEPATPVSDALTARIAVTGRPISTADFMESALLHPQWGYYTRAQTSAVVKDNDFDDDDDDFDNDDATTTSAADRSILPGDFLTSPEITNVFGHTIGAWFWAIQQQQHGASTKTTPYQLVECGPGTGQLLKDWLSVCCADNRPPDAIHLVEQSPALREQQRQTLLHMASTRVQFCFPSPDDEDDAPEPSSSSSSKEVVIPVYWHASLTAFRTWNNNNNNAAAAQRSRRRTLLVAHEFLDALPVYSFEQTADGNLRERLVDVALRADLEQNLLNEEEERKKKKKKNSNTGTSSSTTLPSESDATDAPSTETPPTDLKPRFRMVLAPEVTPPLRTLLTVDEDGRLPDSDDDIPVGTILEVCPQAILFGQDVAALVAETQGAALIIDYGAVGSRDSLRGYTRHAQVDFLRRPGQIDITADVDFGALQHAVHSSTDHAARAYGPLEQGQFLVSMGLGDHVVSIIEKEETTDEMAEQLCEAYKRLVSPDEMGQRYKVMAIVPNGSIPVPFEVMQQKKPSKKRK